MTTYELQEAYFPTDQVFTLENHGVLKLIFVSDYHLRKIDKMQENQIDNPYNYCHQNNIRTVINLGDFYSFWDKKPTFSEVENILDDTIKNYPKDDERQQGILIGNHDRPFIGGKRTLDLMETLSKERSDLISLGWQHAHLNIDCLSFNRNILSVPSFFKDRVQNGNFIKKEEIYQPVLKKD